MGGKTLLSFSGSAIFRPWLILTRLSIMAFSMTLLPAVLAVIARPSRIGTPELSSIAMFWENRATATLRSRSPIIGIRSIILSMFMRPWSVLWYIDMAIATPIMLANIMYQYATKKLLISMAICVGGGNALP